MGCLSCVSFFVIAVAVLCALVVHKAPFMPLACHVASIDCPDGRAMVSGTTHERFARVRTVFESFFSQGFEHGAQLALFHNGELVVDLVGGSMTAESLAVVFSST